jgi:hypothetical protein
MKNIKIVILTSFLSVIMCLILTAILFYTITPRTLLILTLSVGLIAGVFITSLIHSLLVIFNVNKTKNEK